MDNPKYVYLEKFDKVKLKIQSKFAEQDTKFKTVIFQKRIIFIILLLHIIVNILWVILKN